MKNSATIKAPVNPTFLKLAQAIEAANRRTKGSPANLLVPNSLGTMLNRWGYGEPTSATEKLFAAADVGTPGGGPEDLAKLAPLLSIFVGPSRLTDMDLLKKAVSRMDAGDDAAKIWKETGWGKHPTSGQLISEIDDSKMFLKDRPIFPGDEMPMDDALSHPELSKVMDTKRLKLKTGVGKGGSWNRDEKTAMVGAKNTGTEDYKSVLLHELGHAASDRYGFPGGSNIQHYAKQVEDELKNVNKQIFKAGDDPKLMADLLRRKEMVRKEGNMTTERYMDTADEALQRLTQARAKLPASDRRNMYPFDPTYFKQNTSSNIEDLFNQEEYASRFLGNDDLLDVGNVNPEGFVFDDLNAKGMTPDMYDFNRKPDYFRENKGIDVSTQDMPIEDYLREASALNSKTWGVPAEEILASRRANTENIQGIADALRNGTDFAAPYLDYRAGREGQEGFHRTLAAELLGMKTVPVQIRRDVKKAIGPLYRGSQDIKTLESGNYLSPDPTYANEYTEVMGQDWSKPAENPAMGSYLLPDEGHIDFSKEKELRDKMTRLWAGEDDTTFGLEGDLPHYEFARDTEEFLNTERPDWTSFKMFEPGDTGYSYYTKKPVSEYLAWGLKNWKPKK
jgi:hypothetical protein